MTKDIYIVEPLLSSAAGHPVEYVEAFARSAKKLLPNSRIVVLGAPLESAVKTSLNRVPEIDIIEECFQHPAQSRVDDWRAPRFILGGARRNSRFLEAGLRKTEAQRRPLLFFPTLDMVNIFSAAMLKIRMPRLDFMSSGILRMDPLAFSGAVLRTQKALAFGFLSSLLWKSFWRRCVAYADSQPLCDIYNENFDLGCRLSPHLVSGVWELRGARQPEKRHRRGAPLRVGFVGVPGGNLRNFPLFVMAGLAMEKERMCQEVEFVAIVQPDAPDNEASDAFMRILESGLKGLRIERRSMPRPKDFAAAIDEMDVFWNVGDPTWFARGTSGKLVYAACLGKKTLTNKSEWLNSIRRPCSLIREVDPDLESVTRAVREMKDMEPTPACLEEVQRWRKMFSQEAWDEFVGEALCRASETRNT